MIFNSGDYTLMKRNFECCITFLPTDPPKTYTPLKTKRFFDDNQQSDCNESNW